MSGPERRPSSALVVLDVEHVRAGIQRLFLLVTFSEEKAFYLGEQFPSISLALHLSNLLYNILSHLDTPIYHCHYIFM